MSINAYRWQMSKPGAPFERVAFAAEPAVDEVVVAIHALLGFLFDTGFKPSQRLAFTRPIAP